MAEVLEQVRTLLSDRDQRMSASTARILPRAEVEMFGKKPIIEHVVFSRDNEQTTATITAFEGLPFVGRAIGGNDIATKLAAIQNGLQDKISHIRDLTVQERAIPNGRSYLRFDGEDASWVARILEDPEKDHNARKEVALIAGVEYKISK